MSGRFGDRRWRFLACVGGAVYAFFLITASFEHHDITCELKTPQHCTACNSSLVGSDPEAPVLLGAWSLADAGRAVTVQVIADGVLLSVRSTGRSPPTHS
jgi:hypothetical protein